MADEQIIAARLQVDASSTVVASKSIKEMKDNVKQLQDAFENSKGGTIEQAAAFKKLKAAQDDLKSSTTSLGKDIQGSTGHFGKLKDTMGSLPGPFSAASTGAGTLNTAFKALLANPIGLVLAAIVAVLALLYKSFTNTFEGGQKVEQVFAGLKAAAQALFDNLDKIASSIIKIFQFDFSGAIDDMKAVGDAAVGAFKKMADLTKEAQLLKREQLANDLDQAERAKKLAILREQSTDTDIPIAQRKAALKELQAAAEKNAKEDVDLAARTAKNKIAQLTIEKDGALKNEEEITQAKIEALKVETDNANELRRINKQVTVAEKQEIAERKAAAQAAAAASKAERQKLVEFTNKLTQLQQENELAQLKTGYDRELKQLQNKIDSEKRANAVALQDKKISKVQQQQLDAALDIQFGLQKDALDKKRNDETAKKEADFQKELAVIRSKAALSSITDAREVERVQLNIGYEEKLQDAINRYKDDQVKFQQIKQALDEQLRADQAKLDLKNKREDDKKKFELEEQAQKEIISKQESTLAQRQEAIDAEQALVQAAFDNKIISELEYNNKLKELSAARMQVDELETQNKARTFDIIGQGLNALGDLIGKNTALGKAASVAATIINTYEAAWAIFKNAAKNPASIPFPAYPYIQAGLAIAAGLKTVASIVSVKTPGGGGGGSVPAAGSVGGPAAAPVAPIAQSTLIAQPSVQDIGNASRGGRAYVLDADVNNAQERNARLERAARLGG